MVVTLRNAEGNVNRCIERIEFFKVKSTASYRFTALKHWEASLEMWSQIHRQLQMLNYLLQSTDGYSLELKKEFHQEVFRNGKATEIDELVQK